MTEIASPKHGDLRVWWIPQVPGDWFFVPVQTLREARLVTKTLAHYDLFQLEHNIKPDYCNAGGLQVWDETLEPDDDGERWCDWHESIDDGREGRDFDEIPDDELDVAVWESEGKG